MNLTENLINNLTNDDEEKFIETDLYMTLIMCGCVLGMTAVFYVIIYLLKKFKTTNYILKLTMNYMRSVLGGLILSVNDLKRLKHHTRAESSEGFLYYFMNIFPGIQFFLCLFVMAAWILKRLQKKDFDLIDGQYHAISFGEEQSLNEIGENNRNPRTLGRFRRIQFLINQMFRNIYNGIKVFNSIIAPKLILCFIFLHSFYSGLGFDALGTFEVFEIIIVVHKFFEVYLIKHAFEKIKPKKYVEIIYTTIFFLLTPLGIFVRNYLKIQNTYFSYLSSNTLCNSIFYRSLLMTAVLENFIPLPESIAAIILNLVSFIIASIVFGFLLMVHFPSY